MTMAATAVPGRSITAAGTLLLAGIVLAALTEAIAGTVLSLGRGDILGDTSATPDEFAWLDVGYTALKLIGFMTAPWLMSRLDPRSVLVASSASTRYRPTTTSVEVAAVRDWSSPRSKTLTAMR